MFDQMQTLNRTCFIIYQPGSTVIKSSLVEILSRNRFAAVTDAVRVSHAGRLGASTMLVGWSTVALNNTAELLLLTFTKYLRVWFPPGGIPVALSIKVIQEMTAITGIVSSVLTSTSRPLGAFGGPKRGHNICTYCNDSKHLVCVKPASKGTII